MVQTTETVNVGGEMEGLFGGMKAEAENGWGEGYSTTPVMMRLGHEGKTGDFVLFLQRSIEWPWYNGYIPRLVAGCRCGAVWYRDHAVKEEKQEESCPCCGCTTFYHELHRVANGTFLFEDEHKIAIVGFVTRFQLRSQTDLVKGSSYDRSSRPDWVFPSQTKWRVTHNYKSGKTTLVLFIGASRNKVVLPLYGKTQVGIDKLHEYLLHTDPSVFSHFTRELLNRLPDYVVREHGLNEMHALLPTSMKDVSFYGSELKAYEEKLLDLFQLLAYPHLRDAGKLYIVPRSVSERRRIQSAKGQQAMHRVIFPGLSRKTMQTMKTVARFGDQTLLELLTLVHDPNLFRTGLGQLLNRGQRMRQELGGFTMMRLQYPVTHRHGFVRDLFGDTAMFERRLKEARVEHDTLSAARDSLRMYHQLRREMTAKEVRALVSELKGDTIQTVHDGLSRVMWSLNNREVIYAYTQEEKEVYEQDRGQISFRLPETNYTLKEVSSYMRNCVSGYDRYVESKKKYIVTGYVQGDPYVCIGINTDGRGVFEVKTRYNKYLQKDDVHLMDILAYVQSLGSELAEIRDLLHLTEGPDPEGEQTIVRRNDGPRFVHQAQPAEDDVYLF